MKLMNNEEGREDVVRGDGSFGRWQLEVGIVIELIKNGGVGVIPTDIVYNLHSISSSFFFVIYVGSTVVSIWWKNNSWDLFLIS